jgi:hypothetical protein
MEGALRRHREKSGGGEDLLAEMVAALLPFREGTVEARLKVSVGVGNVGVAGVGERDLGDEREGK